MPQEPFPTTGLQAVDYKVLRSELAACSNDSKLFRKIVNLPFDLYKLQMAFIFLGVINLLLVDKRTGFIERVALADTDIASEISTVSPVPHREIKIPLDSKNNIIVDALRTGLPKSTNDWQHLLTPVLSPEEAQINQASGGIACTTVYPLKSRDGGALGFHFFQFQQEAADEQAEFMSKYAELVDQIL